MDKKRKFLLGVGIVLFAALVVWAVTTVPEPPAAPDKPAQSGKIMSYDGNEISEEKNGRKIWDLTAEHIEVDVDTRDVALENLSGHFYAEDGRIVEVKADKGKYAEATKDIVITGNVSVKNSDGAQLTSDELRWEAQKERLAAVGSARAVKEDMLATGDRIESTDGFNKIKITGKAHLAKGGE
ncbi:MAG: LPS export ABC transporter periplasmic protein LptC [Selenomonas sp.]|uniref:LPS export ABC transporter periplasmic protein LptC n=1 Tax=Selenomonas sp. TaxID=2053611 RepID=UPI0025DBA749|nr:LPS export ABC transporter periplasmic protein LptC [Selenomonas sp.]MCR5757063.1 LPS export ABC transporter periplasmic protein LptC [Selenomonas sp.]